MPNESLALYQILIYSRGLMDYLLQVTIVVKRIGEVEKIYFYGVPMYGSKQRATSKLLGREKGQIPPPPPRKRRR